MRWSGIIRAGTVAALACGLAAAIFLAVRDRAPQARLVQDEAGLLDQGQQERISAYHAAILAAYDIGLRVMTVTGTPDLNSLAAAVFAKQQVGGLSDTGRGLLLVIAPDADQVRMEVGRGAEPVFTDAFVASNSARWCRSLRPTAWRTAFWPPPS